MLVAKGYNQYEGINFGETYAPIARLEAVRLLLPYACVMDFKLYYMDVKSIFLNGYIEKEVNVSQPLDFEDYKIQIMYTSIRKLFMDLNKFGHKGPL